MSPLKRMRFVHSGAAAAWICCLRLVEDIFFDLVLHLLPDILR